MRIGQHCHHHNSTARMEQWWAAQKEAVAAVHLVRVDRIERLQKALLSGNIASLLRADMSEATVV